MKIINCILLFSLICMGCTATLHKAVQNGDLKTVQSILQKDRNKINYRDDKEWTPLHEAAWAGHLDVLKYLVTQGADVNAKDNRGDIPLHNATWKNYVEIVAYLVSHGADLNVRNTYGETPLLMTSKKGLFEIAKILISEGANINLKDNRDSTALHYAAHGGYLEIAKYCVTHGGDVNTTDEYGKTPLFYAAFSGHSDIVNLLISAGADVTVKDNSGNTPLHFAAQKKNIDIVKILVSKGADVNAKGTYDLVFLPTAKKVECTPLHIAAYYGRLEIVKYLVSKGADVSVTTDLGKTARRLAELKGLSGVSSFLVSREIPTDSNKLKVSNDLKSSPKKDIVDKAPPKIVIYSHDFSRGMKILQNQSKITIKGRASDESGVAAVIVNNNPVQFDKEGDFVADIPLRIGDNHIMLSSMDRYGNLATKTIKITREPLAVAPKAAQIEAPSGKYYALIIGNNNYRFLKNLTTAQKDAVEVLSVLKHVYGFDTRILMDAKRHDILNAINDFRYILGDNDHFLIYYAGHGVFDEVANKAYWLPVDASRENDTNWIIVDTITSNIKRIAARHVIIVADSCYSGTFTRQTRPDLTSRNQRSRYLEKMLMKSSRTLLASGGNEPVSDVGGKGHSIFAEAFINGLKDMPDSIFSAEELFYQHIKEVVAGGSEQTPEYNPIRNSGHGGGDFVFVRTK